MARVACFLAGLFFEVFVFVVPGAGLAPATFSFSD